MAFQRNRVRLGDLAFWLAVASSTFIGITFVLSMLGSMLGAPPQQAWFTLLIGAGIAVGMVFAFAGVVTAHASRRREGADRRARSALIVGYCILGSLAALAVLGTVALIALSTS
ncbi:MAG TPA: hypothetical protein VI384_05215 [Candidatus Dormibacteraeota bacterium]